MQDKQDKKIDRYTLTRYLNQVLKAYNYIDGIIITDDKGCIEYYNSFRPDLNNIRFSEVVGRSILDVYPELTEENSTIMRVLRTGEHIYDEYQETSSFKGKRRQFLETTLPIRSKGEIVGAINISRYVVKDRKMSDIVLSGEEQYAGVLGVSERKLCGIDNILSESAAMEEIKHTILKVAGTPASVLLVGETGVGKDLIAQALHFHSSRKERPFIYQNCSAIPASLLESILFGTVKGAYTGAQNKPGLFELAEGSTLFLDELNSMDLSIQPKILSAIEKKEVRRVGGEQLISTDVRLVSAMNEDPFELVEQGRLRSDLLFRLNTITIKVPPLRERREDILMLARFFIEQCNERVHKSIDGMTRDVEQVLLAHGWPGNVRELRNVIESATIMCDQALISLNELPHYLLEAGPLAPQAGDDGLTLAQKLDRYEAGLIAQAVEKERSLTGAARRLGISRQSLDYKMKRLGLGR